VENSVLPQDGVRALRTDRCREVACLREEDVAGLIEVRPHQVSLVLTSSEASAEVIDSLRNRDRLSLQTLQYTDRVPHV
jgi:hypothetical protein